MDNYAWICFTDKYGFIYFDGEYSLEFVKSILSLKGCKDFEIHLTDSDTYWFFIKNYLEDCLQLEYEEA